MKHPEFPKITTLLLENVQDVLGTKLVGVYLHGSLALGDYDPHSSDVDFMVVTQTALKRHDVANLERMHQELLQTNRVATLALEGAFMSRSVAKRHDAHATAVPHIHGESFYVARLEPHWVLNRAILHDHGVALFGPPANSLIDAVSILERQQAVREFLSEWWQPMLGQPTKLEDLKYRVYAVQTMARAICTLRTGELPSKPSAIRWALEHCPSAHHDALQSFTPSLEQTLALIQLAVAAQVF